MQGEHDNERQSSAHNARRERAADCVPSLQPLQAEHQESTEQFQLQQQKVEADLKYRESQVRVREFDEPAQSGLHLQEVQLSAA